MFRMWGKLIKDNHLLKDTIIERCSDSLSRTQMVFDALETICYELDLSNVREFKRHNKTRFTQDNFIEQLDFDYLEIHVIEE